MGRHESIALKNLCADYVLFVHSSLFNRLTGWNADWQLHHTALERVSGVPASWAPTPWLFVPEHLAPKVKKFMSALSLQSTPKPRITRLEQVMSW